MQNWLQNEWVIVTGASGGIGRELTKFLVRHYGARVIGVGRCENKMKTLESELGSHSFLYFLFDVSQKNDWLKFRDELQARAIAPILLINNAGVFPAMQTVDALPAALFEQTMQTNFFSAVYAVETLAPLLRKIPNRKPGIVNVCSSAALCPVVGSATYVASKNALKGFTEVLQLERSRDTYVGIAYPGTTATDLFRDDENVRNSAMRKIATSPQKMAKKLAKRIYKRKKRSILGWDAKLMHLTAKLMPVKGPALICKIMKASKSVAFQNVFQYKK